MTTVLLVPGSMSFGNTATLQAAFGGGPAHLLPMLGDNSTPFNVTVKYNDWDTFNGYKDGATKINVAMLDANPTDKIVVFAHSFGAVAACQWLRQYGPTSTINPSRVTFVLIGNSIRPKTGLCALFNMYGGTGPDTSTRYRVYDCARQWDKWADYPNLWNANNWIAANNCNYGDSYPTNIHVSYQHVSLSAPDASATFGNVTFQLYQTTAIPMPGIARNQIEPAYDRVIPNVAF